MFHEFAEFLGIGPRPNIFSSSELQTATEHFNPANELGEGGFWPVYKVNLILLTNNVLHFITFSHCNESIKQFQKYYVAEF